MTTTTTKALVPLIPVSGVFIQLLLYFFSFNYILFIFPGAENDEDGQVENDEIVDATPMCEGDDDDDDNEFDDGMDFAPMPTDEEIEAARREHQESIQSGLNHHSADEDADQTADQQEVFKPLQRQTLLFSATAICALAQLTRRPLSSTKRDKRNKKLKHLSEDIKALPEHLQE